MLYGRLWSRKVAGICIDTGNAFVPMSVIVFAPSMFRHCSISATRASVSLMDDTILGVVNFCPDGLEAAS